MKKAEYIEKYGEEKYKEYLQKNNERLKKWIEKNPEAISRIRKKAMKKWHLDNQEYDKNYNRNWRTINKEKRFLYEKEYRKSIFGRAVNIANSYQALDKKRKFDISHNIEPSWIVENIFSGQACVYCGDNDWAHLGCDRIDNDKPHTADNVVCCCGLCNVEKADRYSVEEFKKYRALHPRACDVPKGPSIVLSPSGALKKKSVPN